MCANRLSTLRLSIMVVTIVLLGSSTGPGNGMPSLPAHVSAEAANRASLCAAMEVPLNMEDPFGVAYNPVNHQVYVLRTGAAAPQVAVLRYGREVARINDFPSGGYYRELTSIGVNPSSGLTYVTQWSDDTVHFISFSA
jgi:DNA-binding beta-propeller fold protein YncE